MGEHLLLVYGTLKKGYGNNHILKDSEYIGERTISAFTMYHLGGFPAITKEPHGPILCELYRINDETLARCDRLEGTPTFYYRELVETEKGEEAYIYFYANPLALPGRASVIKSGIWGGRNS